MPSGPEPINFRVIVDGEEHSLSARIGEYRNLMVLIYDRVYVETFGECRGMGRCGTCRVSIDGDATKLTALDRNESATLARSGVAGPDVRLSCQIIVDHQLEGRTILVLPVG